VKEEIAEDGTVGGGERGRKKGRMEGGKGWKERKEWEKNGRRKLGNWGKDLRSEEERQRRREGVGKNGRRKKEGWAAGRKEWRGGVKEGSREADIECLREKREEREKRSKRNITGQEKRRKERRRRRKNEGNGENIKKGSKDDEEVQEKESEGKEKRNSKYLCMRKRGEKQEIYAWERNQKCKSMTQYAVHSTGTQFGLQYLIAGEK
jgi:hypothetical protein